MAFVFTLFCTRNTVNAQTPDLSEGIRVERLRQAGDIAGLEQLVKASKDKAAVKYAQWNLDLLDARVRGDKQTIEIMIKDALANSANRLGSLPYSVLLEMLAVESRLYDIWATQTPDPTLAIRFGMLDGRTVYELREQTGHFNEYSLGDWTVPLSDYPTGIRQVLAQRAGYLSALMAHIHSLAYDHLSGDQDIIDHIARTRMEALKALKPFDHATSDPWQLAESAAWLKVEIQLAQGKRAEIVEPETATTLPAQLARAMLHAAHGHVAEAKDQLLKDASTPPWQSPQMQLLLADAICHMGLANQQYNLAMSQYVTLLRQNKPYFEQAIHERILRYDWLDDKDKTLSMDQATRHALYEVLLKPVRAGQTLDIKKHRKRFGNLARVDWPSNVKKHPSHPIWLQRRTFSIWRSLAFPDGWTLKMYQQDVFDSLVDILKITKADDDLIYEAMIPAMRIAQMVHQGDRDLWVKSIAPYQDLSRILFTRFNTSQLADDYRLFDVVAVRLPAKEYALALQRLADLPATHPQYWLSLRYQLGIYRQLANHPDWPSQRIVAAIAPIRDQAVRHLPGAADEQQQTIAQVAIEASGMLWQAAVKNQDWQSAADQLQWLESSNHVDTQTKRTWLHRRLVSLQRAAQWQATNRLANQLLNDDGQASFPVIMQIMEVMQQQLQSQTHAVMLGKRDAVDATLLGALSELSQSVVKWAMVNVADEQQVLLAKLIWAKCLKESGQTRDALALLMPLTGQFGDEPDLLMTIAECHFKLASPANDQQAAKLYHQLISRSLPDAQGQFPSRYWQAWTRYLQICDRTNQHTDVIASRITSLKAEDATLGGEPWAALLAELQQRYATGETTVK